MRKPYLEVTYRHGRPIAAYYHLPRATEAASVRSRRVEPGLVIDYSAAGAPLGIEITAPTRVTLEDFNRVLADLGLPALAEAEFAPLHAA